MEVHIYTTQVSSDTLTGTTLELGYWTTIDKMNDGIYPSLQNMGASWKKRKTGYPALGWTPLMFC